MRIPVTILALSLLAAGCTQRADSIGAMPVSPSQYAGASCQQLSDQMETENNRLKELARLQDEEIVGDFRVMGADLGSVAAEGAGNQQAAIAYSKGKINAIDIAMRRQGCAM
ncbi:hypothetical protein [Martelella mangrovi]|uniref:Lipoprotein n=1 Tax=Martelella mangrovi TaxID=1397477 RepID=A0ABV2IGA9_9HYPH|nr:hypothetical protein [uncultured Martelella sp.]